MTCALRDLLFRITLSSLASACVVCGAWAGDFAPPRGLLFEIRAQSSPIPSFLFGTIHSEDRKVAQLPKPVRAAFEASEKIALEVIPDGPAIIKAMMTMTYTDGRRLKDVVSPEAYEEICEALSERGMTEDAFEDFKPWAIMTQLSTPPPATGEFLDMLLYRAAVKHGKHIAGLESMDEQLAIFDGLALADQVALLNETLDARAELPALLARLTSAYLERDLAKLQALSNEHLQSTEPRLAALFQESIVDARNRRMTERILPLVEEGGWFVAVGALHLAGEAGLVSALRQRGYQVAVVY